MRFRITGKQAVRLAGCAVFCLIVCGMAFMNRTLIMEPVTEFLSGRGDFTEMKEAVEENYLGDRLRGKVELLSLNGGFARLEGRLRVNGVLRMENGMLNTAIAEVPDLTGFTENLDRFSRWLEGRGIPFLFVLAPYKGPTEDRIMPAGVTDRTNEIGDRAVSLLREKNVSVLDLREEMSRTREQVEKYFYRTDHHWNADGAFFAYQQIMKAVQARFPGTKTTFTDAALWEKTVIPDWWLGSAGRRVGTLFGGLEDMDLLLPAFETEMSRYAPGIWAFRGDFRKANIREYYVEYRDFLNTDNYHRYLGGGYPLTLHRNQRAENRMKLLIIGDSFKVPVECFLSTEFTAIDVLEPRGYGKMSEADYAALNPPDMVIVLNYPGTLAEVAFSDFGEGREPTVVSETAPLDFTVPAGPGEPDYAVLPARPESGKSYVLTLDAIQLKEGAPEGVNVMLFSGDEERDQTIFDIPYGNEFGFRWGFRVPDEPDGDFQLRFYAGINGGTEGTELVFQGVRLQECDLR